MAQLDFAQFSGIVKTWLVIHCGYIITVQLWNGDQIGTQVFLKRDQVQAHPPPLHPLPEIGGK